LLIWENSSSTGVSRPKIESRALSLLRSPRHLDHLALEILERASGDQDLIALGQVHLHHGLLLGGALEDPIHLLCGRGGGA
jgi:hypothetical protein